MTKVADIKTGDLLAWRRDRRSKSSDFLIRMIKIFTKADYGHVGVAVRGFGDYVFVYEASLPMVKLSLLRPEEEIYHIPVNIEPNDRTLNYFFDRIGLPYSIVDCIRALLGWKSKRDDKWQCAELTRTFYQHHGIDLGDKDTPDHVVKTMMKLTKKDPSLVVW